MKKNLASSPDFVVQELTSDDVGIFSAFYFWNNHNISPCTEYISPGYEGACDYFKTTAAKGGKILGILNERKSTLLAYLLISKGYGGTLWDFHPPRSNLDKVLPLFREHRFITSLSELLTKAERNGAVTAKLRLIESSTYAEWVNGIVIKALESQGFHRRGKDPLDRWEIMKTS